MRIEARLRRLEEAQPRINYDLPVVLEPVETGCYQIVNPGHPWAGRIVNEADLQDLGGLSNIPLARIIDDIPNCEDAAEPQ